MSVNKVILIGNLGQDPDFKYTPNGSAVCTFSIATTEEWKDKNGSKQSKTEWHNIVVWGKPAENANQYLSKGSQVYIEGRLETRSWDDKDGNKRYKTEINATTVQYLSKKEKSHENAPAPKESSSSSSSQGEFASDDIPF